MAKTSVNPNPIELNTSVTRQLRETLMHLARTPGLTKSGTLTELVSYGLAAFLSQKPWERPGWIWQQPQGYYRYVDGARLPNGDWVPLNPRVQDIEVDGRVVPSQQIVDALKSLADHKVPRERKLDTGLSALMYTFLVWLSTELYDPRKYAAIKPSPELKIDASSLRSHQL